MKTRIGLFAKGSVLEPKSQLRKLGIIVELAIYVMVRVGLPMKMPFQNQKKCIVVCVWAEKCHQIGHAEISKGEKNPIVTNRSNYCLFFTFAKLAAITINVVAIAGNALLFESSRNGHPSG